MKIVCFSRFFSPKETFVEDTNFRISGTGSRLFKNSPVFRPSYGMRKLDWEEGGGRTGLTWSVHFGKREKKKHAEKIYENQEIAFLRCVDRAFFPKAGAVVEGKGPNPWEIPPKVDRRRNFRLAVK